MIVVEQQVVVAIHAVIPRLVNSRQTQSVIPVMRIAVPPLVNLPGMGPSVEQVQELVIHRKYAAVQQQLVPKMLLLLMELLAVTPAPSPAHQANAHPETSNAKPSWVPILKETTPTHALPPAAKSLVPRPHSVPSATPCNKTSSTAHPAKAAVAVPTVNATALQSEKKSLPGYPRIKLWSSH